MARLKWAFVPLCCLSIVLAARLRTDERTEPGPSPDATAGLLTISGRVLLPDRSPAAGATVQAAPDRDERPNSSRTNEEGEFRLQGMFGNGCRLHASSADGKLQTTVRIPSSAARKASEKPIELKLHPAVSREVWVVARNLRVEGALVVAGGTFFRSEGVTGADGRALLWVPAGEPLQMLSAFHPQFGVDGRLDYSQPLPDGAITLSLRAPTPHTIRVVDPQGKPVEGLELAIGVNLDGSGWIPLRDFQGAHVRTADDGTAVVPWMPHTPPKYVQVDLLSSEWKIDYTDNGQNSYRITTVEVRRLRPVIGRVIMPEGASAEGTLIIGRGFGPKNRGDISYARARHGGWFTLHVPAEHAYVLGIADLEWASNPWSGLILASEEPEPARVQLEAYAATPITIRVTRGPDRAPVPDAWVEASQPAEVEWVDETGKKRTGGSNIGVWWNTDAQGEIKIGAARGNQKLRLDAHQWNEARTIDVKTADPMVVEFHRGWVGDRHIPGRLLLEGAPYKPVLPVAACGWYFQSNFQLLKAEPSIAADGSFEVAFDAEELSLLVIDAKQHRSGIVQIGPPDERIDVPMQEMASYGGTLLDENAQPLADRVLRLRPIAKRTGQEVVLRDVDYDVAAAQTTDKAGRFRFPAVPPDLPLKLLLDETGEGLQYFLGGSELLFNPGETRENGTAVARRVGGGAQAVRKPLPLEERVKIACRDARLNGMLALIVLEGDDSTGIARLRGRLLDYDAIKEVLRFMPIAVTAEQAENDERAIRGNGWPMPSAGEVVLVLLDGAGKTIVTERFERGDANAAERGAKLIRRHAPPTRDAMSRLANAEKEAQSTGRRLWFIESGPRCGPCFRLARWMDERHAILEKDYVIVKVMGGVDEHFEEVMRKFPASERSGIPWFTILEPDGKVLTASGDGPLGNIGFPTSVEEIRHFRKMLEATVRKITPAEVEALIKSLDGH